MHLYITRMVYIEITYCKILLYLYLCCSTDVSGRPTILKKKPHVKRLSKIPFFQCFHEQRRKI